MIVNLLGAAAVILYTPSIYTLYIPIVVAKRQRLHRHHRCWSVGWSVGWVGWLGHVTCCTDGATGCCFALAAALPARLAFVGLPGLSSLWKSVFIRHALFHSLTRKDKHWGKKYSLVTRNPCLKAKLCLYLTELKQKAS